MGWNDDALEYRELIRAVRACKTLAEERETIAKECAAIRTAFKDEVCVCVRVCSTFLCMRMYILHVCICMRITHIRNETLLFDASS
jgi:hypothetical protein